MIKVIIELISNAFGAAKGWLGYASKRTDLTNAADVKNAAVHRSEADEVAKEVKAVADGDLEEMRRRASE